MFDIFKSNEEEMYIADSVPIEKEKIEHLIKILDVAHEAGCYFDLKLTLTIGKFCIDSFEYTDMKLMKQSKKEKDRIIINYANIITCDDDVLMSSSSVIALENIIDIELNLEFHGKGDKNEEAK